MKTALVETRRDLRCAPTLDGLADALSQLGYGVVRWRSDDLPADADIFVLWNGTHPIYDPMHATIRGRPTLFVELGWLPQDSTFQLDHRGINSEASWAQRPPSYTPSRHLPKRDGDLLVVLQDERDMQIRRPELSPYQQMLPWLKLLRAKSHLPLRVRFHPKAHANPNVVMWLAAHTAVKIDQSDDLEDAMNGAAAVATINSTCGLEAIRAGLPVMCFGSAIYRVPYVCLPVEHGTDVAEWTQAIKDGATALCPNAMGAFIGLVLEHQWTLDDLPHRLAKLLQGEQG